MGKRDFRSFLLEVKLEQNKGGCNVFLWVHGFRTYSVHIWWKFKLHYRFLFCGGRRAYAPLATNVALSHCVFERRKYITYMIGSTPIAHPTYLAATKVVERCQSRNCRRCSQRSDIIRKSSCGAGILINALVIDECYKYVNLDFLDG